MAISPPKPPPRPFFENTDDEPEPEHRVDGDDPRYDTDRCPPSRPAPGDE